MCIRDSLVTDSIIDFCLLISLDSIMKSLLAYLSFTLYGKVFLESVELLKSNVWFKLLLSEIKGDL